MEGKPKGGKPPTDARKLQDGDWVIEFDHGRDQAPIDMTEIQEDFPAAVRKTLTGMGAV